jgi:diguanylate cyclase (GGDEF)-like protein/PAS domain S-box-containing protein
MGTRPRAVLARASTSIEQRLAIEHRVTQALAESGSLGEAAPKIIAAVCETLGWECGTCRAVERAGESLTRVGSWGVATAAVAEFLEQKRTTLRQDPPGGLARRAWLTGEAVWVHDVTTDKTFRRAALALKAGLHSAFAFPIKAGAGVIGVLEFFSRRIHKPDAELLDCTRYIGAHIGQFCQRTEAQEKLERFRIAMDNSADMIVLIDRKTMRYIDVNQTACRLLGYSREELLKMGPQDVLPASREQLERAYDQFIADPSQVHGMLSTYRRKDGSTFPFESTRQVIRSGDGYTIAAISRDISQRIAAEQALRDSESRFRSLSKLSSDWYWEQDAELRFVEMTSEIVGKTGVSAKSHIGKKRWDLPAANMSEADWAAHRAVVEAHQPFHDLELCRYSEDGKLVYVSISGEPIFDAEGRFTGYRGVGKDITARKLTEERIQHLATHDSLTELPNRLMFGRMLAHAIDSAKRYNRTFAVMFIDLDRFKVINDTLGHEAGDQLLQAISVRLKTTLRASDVVARLGGDEFVVLVQEVGDSQQVTAVARKILSAVLKPVDIGGHECRVTASIGISMFPADAADERTLMKNADAAMYLAKEEGKNNFQFYSKELKSTSLEKMALESALRQALEREELALHYQAKKDLKSGAITGVEALLRWNNSRLGSISPAQFIPLAEETGLIVPIGKWVLRAACAQNVAWQRQGLPPVCMAVNLSPRQFADPHLLEDIAAVFRETGMAPTLLELEITEGMVMHNPDRAIQVLRAIKEMGVRLAIDDFGTGYSSLAQLKRFPIDTLKVDRSFIREIPSDAEDKAITEAIIAMGKTLSLTVVAEGVETEAQQLFLQEHACDQMQGYYFSKPVPADDFAALLRLHTAAA